MRVTAVGAVLAVNVALAAGLAFLWHDPDRYRWVEPEPVRPALDDAVVAAVQEAVDVSPYRETIERPVFAPTRRPAPRQAAGSEAKPAVDPLKDVRLLGLYGAGGRGGALVNHDGKVQRVPFGGKIGEWTVEGEDGRSATFVRSGGERQQLPMALNTAAPAVPAAAASGEKAAGLPPTAAPSDAGATSQSQPSAAGPAAASSAGAAGDEARQRRSRERNARMNARRVERGLPPLKEQ